MNTAVKKLKYYLQYRPVASLVRISNRGNKGRVFPPPHREGKLLQTNMTQILTSRKEIPRSHLRMFNPRKSMKQRRAFYALYCASYSITAQRYEGNCNFFRPPDWRKLGRSVACTPEADVHFLMALWFLKHVHQRFFVFFFGVVPTYCLFIKNKPCLIRCNKQFAKSSIRLSFPAYSTFYEVFGVFEQIFVTFARASINRHFPYFQESLKLALITLLVLCLSRKLTLFPYVLPFSKNQRAARKFWSFLHSRVFHCLRVPGYQFTLGWIRMNRLNLKKSCPLSKFQHIKSTFRNEKNLRVQSYVVENGLTCILFNTRQRGLTLSQNFIRAALFSRSIFARLSVRGRQLEFFPRECEIQGAL